MCKNTVEHAFEQWINKKIEGSTILERCTKYLVTSTEIELVKQSLRCGFYAGRNRSSECNNSSTIAPNG